MTTADPRRPNLPSATAGAHGVPGSRSIIPIGVATQSRLSPVCPLRNQLHQRRARQSDALGRSEKLSNDFVARSASGALRAHAVGEPIFGEHLY